MYYFTDLIVPTYSVNHFYNLGRLAIFKAYKRVEIWTLFSANCQALNSRKFFVAWGQMMVGFEALKFGGCFT